MSVFLPFDHDILNFPKDNTCWLASGITQLPEKEWQPILDVQLPWRPSYVEFEAAGFNVFAQFTDKNDYDGGLLQLGKHKGQNHNRFLDMIQKIKPGGRIVVSGDKTAGVAPMMKWVKGFLEINDKLSKNHGMVFWLQIPQNLNEKRLAELRNPAIHFDDVYTTQAGMFSHGRVDAGSAMLVPYLKKTVFGKTADFGAGWGYLSCRILETEEKLGELDLYEADFDALEMAKQHIEKIKPAKPIAYHWQDLTREPVSEIYDTIVTNPPFHEGRSADLCLGQSFLEVAAKRLKPGGCLLMVANRQLAYEATLKSLFRKVIPLEEANGFKIIEARK